MSRSITLLRKQRPINRSFNTMNLLAGDVMYQNLFAARPEDRNPASLARERIEEEEYNKDGI